MNKDSLSEFNKACDDALKTNSHQEPILVRILWNEWVRWAIMPIACIVGLIVVFLLSTYFQRLQIWLFPSKLDEFLIPYISSMVAGMCWTKIAFSLAPKYKKITSIVMVTILGSYYLFSYLICVHLRIDFSFQGLVGSVITSISSIIMVGQLDES